MSFDLTNLGEYASVQGGYAYKSRDFSADGTCPVLKIKNVRFGTVDYTEASLINEEIASETTDWKTKEGDILISMTGSGPNAPQSLVGRVARIWENEPEAWINQRVGRIVLKEDKIHPDFLFYLLSSPRSQDYLVSNSSGSANQANISGKTIESLPCPKINYVQSAEIAKILRELDQKIINNRKTNQTLEQIAQAIFKSWFVDFEPVKAKIIIKEKGGNELAQSLAAQAVICGAITLEQLEELESEFPPLEDQLHPLITERFPDQTGLDYWQPETLAETAALFPNALVESDLGEIPEGWAVKSINDVVNRLKSKKRYTKKQVAQFGKVPVYEQGANILLGYHDDEPGFIATTENPLFIFGDHTCVLNLSCESFDISQNVIPLSGEGYPTIWVYYAIQGKQEFQEYRRHWSELIVKKVITPSEDLAIQFSQLVKIFCEQKENLIRQNKTLEQTRDALLPKLLSGELVNDSE